MPSLHPARQHNPNGAKNHLLARALKPLKKKANIEVL
jgi:hypothetical protein